MIYAVTLNPAIDKYIDVDNFLLNNTNYYEKEINRFGGKAINVAKMLNNFTNDYQLVTKTSIATNDLINQDLVDINKKLFNTNKIRTNYKINANGVITELNQNLFDSASINSSLKIFEYLKQQVTSKDIIIFSGSMTEMEIKEIIKFNKDIKIVIDSSSITLADLQTIKPFAYKPNIDELEKLYNTKLNNNEIETKANELNKLDIKHVIVSLGSEGGIYKSKQMLYKYAIHKGVVVNNVGAGDSFLAGFIFAINANMQPNDAIEFANACAGATVFTTDIATKQEIDKLLTSN
jgi:1-phosphofructokinase